ncbi:unnamed protein product [Phytophthora lilii]|uniref:Unnamed protein product n=1 Tax=Phytophthora lilii TaxID=2077276 RepID=A0A9W6TY61_9STRA|nr:unnamed protein product [Phytophthora lilii]
MAGPAVVHRLKAELQQRVAETLSSVCGAFRQELELAAQPPAPPPGANTVAALETAIKTEIALADQVWSLGERTTISLQATQQEVAGRQQGGDARSLSRDKKRPTARSSLSTAPPAKKPRFEEVIEIWSSADENEDGESAKLDANADCIGGRVDTETETEEEEEEDSDTNGAIDLICSDGDDEDKDADWVESDNDEGDYAEDDEGKIICKFIVDPVGMLCHAEQRSPRQTKALEIDCTRVYSSWMLYCVDQLPENIALETVASCASNGVRTDDLAKNQLCQLWHEVDAHVLCCRNEQFLQHRTCEYSIQVMLRETMHQIEHQHECIRNVREELKVRKEELREANASHKERRRAAGILSVCQKVNSDAAKATGVDTVADMIDFKAHYMKKRPALKTNRNASAQTSENLTPRTQPSSKVEDLLPSLDDVIGKLCYAGQRLQQQTEMFKGCLRKSIEFVDASLCKPPLGKVCARNCKKIRDNRCTADIPCDNEMCRNWHNAEAHTDNCFNPQCEFKLRIVLREKDQEHIKKHYGEFSLLDPRNRDRFLEFELLQDEINQLEADILREENLLRDLNTKKKEHQDKLFTIGIDDNDDEIDGFPDFTTHYDKQAGCKKA